MSSSPSAALNFNYFAKIIFISNCSQSIQKQKTQKMPLSDAERMKRIKEYQKRHYQCNREKHRNYQQTYYVQNKQAILARKQRSSSKRQPPPPRPPPQPPQGKQKMNKD
jgi:hypothetical protein